MKKGSLNLFFKGVDSDSDEGFISNQNLRDANNIRIVSKGGNSMEISNLKGTNDSNGFVITIGYVPLGYNVINGVAYIISYNPDDELVEFGSFPSPKNAGNCAIQDDFERVYKPFYNLDDSSGNRIPLRIDSNTLNINGDHLMSVQLRHEYDNSVNLYFADYTNPIRVINSGFNLENGKCTNKIYSENEFPYAIEANNASAKNGTVDSLEMIENGSSLNKQGTYFFFFRYLDQQLNSTPFTVPIGNLTSFKDSLDTAMGIMGTNYGELDDSCLKDFVLSLSDLDTAYEFIEISLVRYYGDLRESYLLVNPFQINPDGTCQVTINGNESTIDLADDFDSIETLISNEPTKADIVKSLAQVDNILFGGNVKERVTTTPELIDAIKKITIGYQIEEVDDAWLEHEAHPNSLSSTIYGYKKYQESTNGIGYFRGETYQFGAIVGFEDGRETEPLPITGYDYYNGTPISINEDGIVRFPSSDIEPLLTFGSLAGTGTARNVDPTGTKVRKMKVKFDLSSFNSDTVDKSRISYIRFVRKERRTDLIYQGALLKTFGRGADTWTADTTNTQMQELYFDSGQSGKSGDWDHTGASDTFGSYRFPLLGGNAKESVSPYTNMSGSTAPFPLQWNVNGDKAFRWYINNVGNGNSQGSMFGINPTSVFDTDPSLTGYENWYSSPNSQFLNIATGFFAFFSPDHQTMATQMAIRGDLRKASLQNDSYYVKDVYQMMYRSYDWRMFEVESYLDFKSRSIGTLSFDSVAYEYDSQRNVQNGFTSWLAYDDIVFENSGDTVTMMSMFFSPYAGVTKDTGDTFDISHNLPSTPDVQDGSYYYDVASQWNSQAIDVINIYSRDIENGYDYTSLYNFNDGNLFYSIGRGHDYSTPPSVVYEYDGDCYLQRHWCNIYQCPKKEDTEGLYSSGLFGNDDSPNKNLLNDYNSSGYLYRQGQSFSFITEQRFNHAMRGEYEYDQYIYPTTKYSWLNFTNVFDTNNYLTNFLYSSYNRAIEDVNGKAGIDENSPLYNVEDLKYPTRIIFSEKHTPNTSVDYYRQFGINNYRDYNFKHGQIHKILEYQSKLFSIQESAINVHGVNERAVIPTEDGTGNSILGDGSVLAEQVNALTTQYGTTHQWSIIEGMRGFYGVDAYKRKIWRVGAGFEPLSETKKYDSKVESIFFDLQGNGNQSDIVNKIPDNPMFTSGIVGFFDNKYNEVGWTFSNLGNHGEGYENPTIRFDEDIDAFIGTCDYNSNFYFTINNDMYSINALTTPPFWNGTFQATASLHDDNDDRGYFHSNYYPSWISYIVSEDPFIPKIFDHIQINSNPVEFTTNRFETEIQEVEEDFNMNTNSRYIDPQYKENFWRKPIPRSQTIKDGRDVYQIASPMRGKTLFSKLVYDGIEEMKIRSVTTFYRQSKQ